MGTQEVNHRLASLYGNLSNAVRIEILEFLLEEANEAYLAEISDYVDRTNTTISRHMSKLADYDLVRSETRGRRKYFWIKRPDLVRACLEIREFLIRDSDTNL